MDIKVEVGPITLDTVIGEKRVYDSDGEDYTSEDVTLGDAIARKVFADLKRDDSYNTLRKQATDIRAEEIRAQVKPLVEEALTKPIQRTNTYGEPSGGSTTLTELILDEVRSYLNRRDESYNARDKRTAIQKFIAEAVDVAVKKELAEVIVEEKRKVVDAVRAKAADLIADAVKQGIGR